jgi:hypothetical protein
MRIHFRLRGTPAAQQTLVLTHVQQSAMQFFFAEFLMYAEGVDESGKHSIAVMRSQDQGQTWNICNGGKPVIVGPGSVGTACVVRPESGGADDWWVYCVTSVDGPFSIALARSSTGPEGPFEWFED